VFPFEVSSRDMNVEHLHRVAQLVWDELESTDAPGLISRLRNGLETFSASPSDAQAQQLISEARLGLQGVLPDAPSNTLPRSDRQVLDEIGISEVLGQRLLDRVEEILTRNEMTPSVALSETEPINGRLKEVVESLQLLLRALDAFGIGMDDLVDDYEVGVAIPRVAKSTLPELGREFVELQKIFGTFEELAGEGRPDFKVRALASSDFALFLLASPETALVLAQVLNVIVDTYDKILAIKQKRGELAALMPENRLREIDAHANEVMAETLTGLAQELVANSSLADGRRNEMVMNVSWSLNRIANRIDGGYTIDIRTPPVPEEPEAPAEGEEPDKAALDARAQALEIKQLGERIRRLETGGSRILELPEGDLPDDNGDGQASPA
jgi:hypothetical protein